MHITYKNGFVWKCPSINTLAYYLLQFPSHLLQTTEQVYNILLRGGFNNSIPKTVFPMNFSKDIYKVLFYYLYI